MNSIKQSCGNKRPNLKKLLFTFEIRSPCWPLGNLVIKHYCLSPSLNEPLCMFSVTSARGADENNELG